MDQIKKLRKIIDNFDRKIIKLLEERFRVASQIFIIKQKRGIILDDQKREQEILKKIIKYTKNELLKELIYMIYPQIFKIGKQSWIFNSKGRCSFKSIGIIGLGLIGGSIVKALKFKNRNIKIYSIQRKNDKDIELANRFGFLDGICKTWEEFLNKVDLIIIATPISSIKKVAKIIFNFKSINKKILIIDVGSVKENIVHEFKTLTNNNFEFLGTHPMAGGDKIGFQNSSPFIFLNYPWIIIPHNKNKKSSILKIKNLIEYLGAKSEILKAKDHDKFLSIVSHLIFIISCYLFAFSVEKNKKLLKFAGRGFRDITRLAGGNPKMHNQIFINNYENIKIAINDFLEFINKNKITKLNALKFFKKYKLKRDKFI